EALADLAGHQPGPEVDPDLPEIVERALIALDSVQHAGQALVPEVEGEVFLDLPRGIDHLHDENAALVVFTEPEVEGDILQRLCLEWKTPACSFGVLYRNIRCYGSGLLESPHEPGRPPRLQADRREPVPRGPRPLL